MKKEVYICYQLHLSGVPSKSEQFDTPEEGTMFTWDFACKHLCALNPSSTWGLRSDTHTPLR